jgi:hypothetical protein
MKKEPIKQIEKFSSDLLRFNDPSVGWGEGEQYLRYLAWGRATLTFAVSLAVAGAATWAYVQLRHDPSQQFLQNCQQQGLDARVCTSRWDRTRS